MAVLDVTGLNNITVTGRLEEAAGQVEAAAAGESGLQLPRGPGVRPRHPRRGRQLQHRSSARCPYSDKWWQNDLVVKFI